MELAARGGPFIWLLLAISVLTVWVLLERGWYFLSEHRELVSGLDDVEPGSNPGAEREARSVLERAESRTWLLGLVGRIAPLVGLLGTVSGMIRIFLELEDAGAGGFGASELAGGVWEALLTTAFGLAIAVPALAGYDYFNRLADRTRSELEGWLEQVEEEQS